MLPRRPRVVAGVAMLVLLSGCGGSSAPSDAVPALGTSLERVDDAIVEGRYDDARSQLDELVATTTAARDDGDLGGAEADRILAAAAQVMSALPAEPIEEEPVEDPAPSEEHSPTETEEPSPTPQESPSESEDSEEEQKEQEEVEKEQEKLEEELQKEEEKEEGGGNSSGNGPDDGKGN